MPVSLDNSGGTAVIHISGVTSPDEGEELLAMLLENPGGSVDLSELEHLHTALLQILLTANVPVVAWPEDRFWRMCFEVTTAPFPLREMD